MRKINVEDGTLSSFSLYIYTARRLKLIFETCSYPTTAVVKLHFVSLKVGYYFSGIWKLN